MNSENTEGIFLYQLWTMVWYRLPLIILCGLVMLVICLGISFIMPEEYPVTAVIRTETIPEIRSYSTAEIRYFLSNDDILEKYVEKGTSLWTLKDRMKITEDSDVGHICISIAKTDEPEFWFSLINGLVDEVNARVSNEYRERANRELDRINSDIEILEGIKSDYHETYAELIILKSSIQRGLDVFEDALTLVKKPSIGQKASMGTLILCILGLFIGCVLGAVCAIFAGLTDKHLDLSENMLGIIRKGKLVLTIPAHKNESELDNRYFECLSTILKDEDRNILVTSISDRVGVTTIANGLKFVLNDVDRRNIQDCESFRAKPSILNDIKNADKTIVIVGRGTDTIQDIKLMDKALAQIGCNDVAYVFNFAIRNDSNAIKYLSSNHYEGRKYRLW